MVKDDNGKLEAETDWRDSRHPRSDTTSKFPWSTGSAHERGPRYSGRIPFGAFFAICNCLPLPATSAATHEDYARATSISLSRSMAGLLEGMRPKSTTTLGGFLYNRNTSV
eukprot:CAMPEP_0178479378 /NCGR_PEP_ID=MMETSP0696-20121128/5146_1 /TAXON_ID=265572 /ORGANISM="Extubocellulus spinifer, Strain CCMP396" /LENGTH=110 /DNA_ID=CAMNT_0020106779 /DNA_START=1851 /DNA_END=2183 /DNA_ORIENTATION=-